MEWLSYRPDAIYVWGDERVRNALSWYRVVMRDEAPAKFMIAKSIPSPEDPSTLSLKDLWSLHKKLHVEFEKEWKKAREGELGLRDVKPVEQSYLHVKVEIAKRMIRRCSFCERRCGVNRDVGQQGFCGLDHNTIVSSYFHHIGEEAPLVPSGTIFYCGCNFRCVYCQNWEISQLRPYQGTIVDAVELARIQERLRRMGARNINHVGGDPTPNIHTILESMLYVRINVPQIWNSNFYMTLEATMLLQDVIDLWLPDFKYWSNECAQKLSSVPRYREVVTRNLKIAASSGDIIIRHLILPGHLECCTKPLLRWIAENLPRNKTIVNIMDQYRPDYKVLEEPEKWKNISRRITRRELEEALHEADKLGILHSIV